MEEQKIQSKPTIGVVTISKNEEQDLPFFLQHLVDWVDEIIIIDDNSTDNSMNIARSFGDKVKFLVSPRIENEYFSHQRNKGIELASTDWIVHMDIDERIPNELKLEMLEAIQNPNYVAYKYFRDNYFLHRSMRGGGWTTWNRPHLAKRNAFLFGGMFHENQTFNVENPNIGQLSHKMIHLNDATFSERMEKSKRYLPEFIADLKRKNLKVKALHFATYPAKVFLKKYILQKGFLDGTLGFIWAIHSSVAIFQALSLLWDEQNRILRAELEQKIHPSKRQKQ
jgi:glycosyltransferase involved in cell wall biosynthesis